MAKAAATMPGKIGDMLYAIPTIRIIAEEYGPVAFFTSKYCTPTKRLMERQQCVESFEIPDDYVIENMGCGIQPWYMEIPNKYSYKVFHLGFRRTPDIPLHQFIARETVGRPAGPICYDYDPVPTIDGPYYVLAPRGETQFRIMFEQFIAMSRIPVVQIGGTGDAIRGGIDKTGLDFLDTLPWIANSIGFVGIMSAMLVLANGFDIPKVAPHDGRSWDMRHVVYSNNNYYPLLPNVMSIFRILENA